LIKNEEIPAPLGFINQHKLFRKGKERPYTSLSHRSKNSTDQISLNRVSAVLHITKNED
jgi:predicted lipoprotein